ncbi:MAG: delta-aminolevulinic acid dehydratase [SAR202 cluster bacterium Io17-Chloro-G9]|nr:MAG: delta-aminolevulinic acid dehydratase [SAR202 cluster bacterium Io17-Chloro-G9]
MTSFPDIRLRRLRGSGAMRDLVKETRLSPKEFVYPMFVTHGQGVREPIEPMPGNFQMSLDVLSEEVGEIADLGIPAVLLFGLPAEKDPLGTEGYDPEGIVQEAVRMIKKSTPDMLVITDVCMCEYTDHGHCGVIADGRVDNDQTLELLAKTAVSHVQAGADLPAPSAMMDGQVWAIRQALNDQGYDDTPIMGYAAKYASGFYGPFRVAAGSTPQFGDRKSYQMDPSNVRMAVREIETDIAEGADIIMVKPALAYLDVIKEAREKFNLPLAAYNVSGEFSMVKAAAQQGWVDGKTVTMELLTAIKRAGADIILSYHAKEVAQWLREAE